MPLMDNGSDLDINSIIFATDFSLYSQNAGFYASRLARFFSVPLMVAHAFTLSEPAMEVEIDPGLVSQQRKDLESLLVTKAAALGSKPVKTLPVLVEGDPKVALPELADKHAPALLVLGTHGGGWIERSILGSVAESILRSTRWPTLTVGPQVPQAGPGTLPFRRVLYATDFTPAAAQAAVFAVSFAEAFGAAIDVLHVVERGEVEHPDRIAEVRQEFYAALDRIVPERVRDLCDSRSFVEVGDAHEEILEHIREHSIDLLILGVHKAEHLRMEMRLSRMFSLILDARCPVLTITSGG